MASPLIYMYTSQQTECSSVYKDFLVCSSQRQSNLVTLWQCCCGLCRSNCAGKSQSVLDNTRPFLSVRTVTTILESATFVSYSVSIRQRYQSIEMPQYLSYIVTISTSNLTLRDSRSTHSWSWWRYHRFRNRTCRGCGAEMDAALLPVNQWIFKETSKHSMKMGS